MKRWVFRIVLFLLLGAIINVAVAWGLAIGIKQAGDVRSSTHGVSEGGMNYRIWMVCEYKEFNLTHIHSTWLEGSGHASISDDFDHIAESLIPRWAVQITPMFKQRNSSNIISAQAWEYGWPARSLCGAAVCTDSHIDRYYAVGDDADLFSGRSVHMGNIRPIILKPLWPGFAINTSFYAAIIYILLLSSITLHRGRRIKRGLCPKCAYPVGVSDTCTECGRPVKRKIIAQKDGAA